MMPRARCVIRYLYRSARVAGVANLRDSENIEYSEWRESRRDPPLARPPPAMPEMRYAEQGPRGVEQPRFTRGGRTRQRSEELARATSLDSPVVVVYRFTTGGIPADAR